MGKFIPTLALMGKVLVVIIADKMFGISDMAVKMLGGFGSRG